MLEEMVDGYERAMAGRFDRQTEKNFRPKVIRAIFERSIRRTWKQLAEERIEDEKPTIPLGKRFWALTNKERKDLEKLFRRHVDLVVASAIKNPYFRESVNQTKILLYAA